MSNTLTSLAELIITNLELWHSDLGDKYWALGTICDGAMEYWSIGVMGVFQFKQCRNVQVKAAL